jgi:hypothetical protein
MRVQRLARTRKRSNPPPKKSCEKEFQNLYNIVKERYGNWLTAEELEEVKKDVQAIEETSKALRAMKLHNSDEPFFVFRPYKGRK